MDFYIIMQLLPQTETFILGKKYRDIKSVNMHVYIESLEDIQGGRTPYLFRSQLHLSGIPWQGRWDLSEWVTWGFPTDWETLSWWKTALSGFVPPHRGLAGLESSKHRMQYTFQHHAWHFRHTPVPMRTEASSLQFGLSFSLGFCVFHTCCLNCEEKMFHSG